MPDGRATWLVTGATGQVGGALVAAPPVDVRIVAPPREHFDLAEAFDASELIAREGITAIVNCGAYTAVDRAEGEADLAMAINGRAPGILAHAAAGADIPIIQVSTDYIFAGDKTGAYREEDEPAPLGVYGRTKLAGEQAIIASGARYAIVRTAWVVSAYGQNFVKTMIRLASERDTLNVVADQRGTPTHAGDLAAALGIVTKAFGQDRQKSGIWHFANRGEASWYDVANRVFARAALHGSKSPVVRPIATSEYPTTARRPANSLLATDRIERDFGIIPRPWGLAVDDVVDAYYDKLSKGRTV